LNFCNRVTLLASCFPLYLHPNNLR